MRTFYNITRGLRAVADLFLPRVCVVCGRRLLLNERIICLYCQADIPLTHFWKMKSNAMADRFNAVIQVGLEKAWEAEDEEYQGIYDAGGDGSGDEFTQMERLQEMTGVKIPKNLANLRQKSEKHTGVIDKDTMLEYVLNL